MKIQFINGPLAGETRELQPPGVSIGREDDNDIQLLVAGVSRYHAKISFDGLAWSITDAGSTNGTKLNKIPLKTTKQLSPGDVITLGNQIILFGPGESSVPEAASMEKTMTITAPAREEVQIREKTSVIRTELPGKTEAEKLPGTDKEAEDAEKKGKSLKDIKLSGSIFGGKDKKSAEKDMDTQFSAGKDKKKRLSNFLFYTLLIWAVIILLGCFLLFSSDGTANEKNTDASSAKKTEQFQLSYEYKKIDPDNVFRFGLEISPSGTDITIDDLRYQRHFHKHIEKVNEKYLATLKNALNSSGFMTLKTDADTSAVSGTDSIKTLSVIIDGKYHSIRLRNTYPPTSFELAERAISDFAANYDIRTDIMTVEEMRKEAMKTFAKAEQLYRNREGNPKNLQEAIKRYKLTKDYLEQFDPKPEEWIISRKRLEEASAIRSQKIKNLNFDINQAYRLKQYARAIALCQQVLDMLDEDDPVFQKTRKVKLNLEDLQRKNTLLSEIL